MNFCEGMGYTLHLLHFEMGQLTLEDGMGLRWDELQAKYLLQAIKKTRSNTLFVFQVQSSTTQFIANLREHSHCIQAFNKWILVGSFLTTRFAFEHVQWLKVNVISSPICAQQSWLSPLLLHFAWIKLFTSNPTFNKSQQILSRNLFLNRKQIQAFGSMLVRHFVALKAAHVKMCKVSAWKEDSVIFEPDSGSWFVSASSWTCSKSSTDSH